MTHTMLSPLCGSADISGTRPPAPEVTELRRLVDARLNAIETERLPELAIQRAFLVRTWSTADDGEPVFTMAGELICAHPVGAARLACVLAEEEALTREALALRELAAALALYDAGGSSKLRVVGQGAASRVTAVASDAADCGGLEGAERAYTRWLLKYLLDLKRAIWTAREHGDARRLEDLHAECAELEARVQCHVAGERVTSLGHGEPDSAPLALIP